MNHRITALLCAAVCASAAQAHHSFSMFDLAKSVTIEGTVRTVEWTAPHAWIWVDVAGADGKTTAWGIETGSPSMLQRRGLQRTTFKPGDKLKVELHPMRDGSPGGNFMKATFEDGRTVAIAVGKEEQ